MMNISSRLFSSLAALALVGLVGCKDSGHSLGDSRDRDAGKSDAPVAAGGSTGSGGASISSARNAGSSGSVGSAAGSTSTGGSGGGAGGQSGSSPSSDAGVGSDTWVSGCALRGESCANRSCCGLVCMNFTNPPTCYESMRPPVDAALSADTRPNDSKCPVCDPMKCTYGSPVDSNGCMLCQCNPAPDGGADTSPRCPPGGCLDADLSTPCPSKPPTDGSSCVGQSVCNYEDCPGTGHTQATCRSDKWVVNNGACGTVICLGQYVSGRTCPSGKVCLVHAGGALLVDCIDNPCGSGLVSADCSGATAGCTPVLSTSSGLTFYCDTCTTPPCA